jgi:hypothetical protein
MDGGVSFRWADRERSTILFRRPVGARHAIVEVAPRDGIPVEMEVALDGRNLGRKALAAGWQEIPFPLPDAGRPVERLTLLWSSPEGGPRARLRALRLE